MRGGDVSMFRTHGGECTCGVSRQETGTVAHPGHRPMAASERERSRVDAGAEDGAPLLERHRELERIRQHLRQARDGGGGALLVGGPAGIGKTAMLDAARSAAEGEGFRVLRARGAELEREFAFGVVRQLVEPLLAKALDAERAALLEGPAELAAR